MKLSFPSAEFDEAVAAVCHGSFTEEQARALNELLRSDATARDEYLVRVELHSRLASDADLFAAAESAEDGSAGAAGEDRTKVVPLPSRTSWRRQTLGWAAALAACLVLAAAVAGWWNWQSSRPVGRKGATSKAVAMLNGMVDAQWSSGTSAPQVGAPLDPGWLRLESGLIEVVFYSGARVVVQGPAEFQLVSSNEASCSEGRLIAEVPPQARGYRMVTPQMAATDLGTVFGVDVRDGATELHVFEGTVEFAASSDRMVQTLNEGAGARAEGERPSTLISADAQVFASLFDLQDKAVAAESSRYQRWRAASSQLNRDGSLLVHFDFQGQASTDWRLPNAAGGGGEAVPDGTIVGCQWGTGRWPEKAALEFRSVSDRVRLSVPGEYDSLTATAWVQVHGLDRQVSSLLMSDGFEAGTVHWLIRDDGVLGLTVIGPGLGNYQIITSPPVLRLDQFGRWLHLAVVLDGGAKQVSHYINGRRVSRQALKIAPPFHIGTAELGNWNGQGFPDNDPFMIRNFSGAMDEFCLFSRALTDAEIRAHARNEQLRR